MWAQKGTLLVALSTACTTGLLMRGDLRFIMLQWITLLHPGLVGMVYTAMMKAPPASYLGTGTAEQGSRWSQAANACPQLGHGVATQP